jgi:hypothetical protein
LAQSNPIILLSWGNMKPQHSFLQSRNPWFLNNHGPFSGNPVEFHCS